MRPSIEFTKTDELDRGAGENFRVSIELDSMKKKPPRTPAEKPPLPIVIRLPDSALSHFSQDGPGVRFAVFVVSSLVKVIVATTPVALIVSKHLGLW